MNLLFLLIVTGLMGIMAAFNLHLSRQEREAALQKDLGAIVERLSGSLPAAVWNFDQGQIDRIVAAEMGSAYVDSIVVMQDKKLVGGQSRDAEGKPVALKQAPEASPTQKVATLVYEEGGKRNEIGSVTVQPSYESIRQAMWRDLIRQLVQAVALAAVLLTALSLCLAKVVLRPLNAVRTALEEIGAGSADLTRRLPAEGSAEFVGIAAGFNAFVARLEGVVEEVRSQADSVASGSQEIADGNLDLSQRTMETASHVQSIAQTVTEMRRSVEVNAKGAELADRCGREAAAVADRGGKLMVGVVGTMDDMSASARRITDITSVIDAIAFQTNILALNARIEAARAGTHGRGFAVVAGEVRTLAQRSADAAREIKDLINDTVTKVDSGQQQVGAAGQTIKEVVGAIRKVSEILGGITSASQEQRDAISQVSEGITGIDQATQRNTALVERVSAAASGVRESINGLVDTVGVFKVVDRA